MRIKNKRVIFWTLCSLFAVYSFQVYTSGTHHPKNIENYSPKAKQGKLVFQQYNCISCHQIYGLGGYMGPDLTNVVGTEGKGELYAKAFIMSGTDKMPKFDMSEEELNNLLEYLKYVDGAGKYPVTEFQTTWFGTVEEE